MKSNIFTIGLGFGDEGKGSFIQYLSKKNPSCKYFIKYNGGCQASHEVVYMGRKFKFAQLSPSMLLKEKYTVLTDNFIINLFNLWNECVEFCNVFNYELKYPLSHILIDNNCICVTPIHKLYNRIEEREIGERGSVGIGVSIAGLWQIENGVLRVKDVFDINKVISILKVQQDYAVKQCTEKGLPFNEILQFDVEDFAKNLKNMCSIVKFSFIDTKEIIKKNKCIYESSQGFLIDKDFGFYPNTTYLDTTMRTLDFIQGERIGFIRCIYTRHGQGLFLTETKELTNLFGNDGQEIGKYNGHIRYGYFDCVLFDYACRNCKIDKVYMSHLDDLKYLDSIKICESYLYNGEITEEFKDLFDFEKTNEGVKIKGIKKSSKLLTQYLEDCIPIYYEVCFIKSGINSLKEKILVYIKEIENLTKKSIVVYSKGATYKDKIVVSG